MAQFNKISQAIPVTSVGYAVLHGIQNYYDLTIMLASTIALAGSMQYSRWAKSKLKSEFNEIFNEFPEKHRPETLNHLYNTFSQYTNPDSNIITKHDLGKKNIFVTSFIAGISPPVAPIIFFANGQRNEKVETMTLKTETEMAAQRLNLKLALA